MTCPGVKYLAQYRMQLAQTYGSTKWKIIKYEPEGPKHNRPSTVGVRINLIIASGCTLDLTKSNT